MNAPLLECAQRFLKVAPLQMARQTPVEVAVISDFGLAAEQWLDLATAQYMDQNHMFLRAHLNRLHKSFREAGFANVCEYNQE